MAIIRTKETYYYELDWYTPVDYVNKVYIAIRGIIEKGTVLPIMLDGGGYDWEEEDNSKIKSISKEEFLKKANEKNIVYFMDADSRNYLLHYPKKLQNVIDNQLLNMGIKPHKRLTGKEKLQLMNARNKIQKRIEEYKKSCKKDRCR